MDSKNRLVGLFIDFNVYRKANNCRNIQFFEIVADERDRASVAELGFLVFPAKLRNLKYQMLIDIFHQWQRQSGVESCTRLMF
mgnify:CR=1 FL=1